MAVVIIPDGRFAVEPVGFFSYEEARSRIVALLGLMQASDFEMVSKEQIYAACSMIEDLLPTLDDFLLLEKHHRAK